MTIIDVLRKADKTSYGKATLYFVITGIISILPMLLTIVAFSIMGNQVNISEFIIHGEAGICAIGILLWAGILVARELKPPFAHRSIFQTICSILLVCSVVIFIVARISETIDIVTLSWYSYPLVILSLFFGWVVVLIDSVRERFNPQEEREQQINTLAGELKELDDE